MSQKALTASVLSILCAFVVTGWLLWQGEEAPPVNADPAGQAPAAAAPETPAGPLAQADAGNRTGPEAVRRAADEAPRGTANGTATARKVKLTGRLVDEQGQGVPSVELSWNAFTGAFPMLERLQPRPERPADAKSDARGDFSLFVDAGRGGSLAPRGREHVFAELDAGAVGATDKDQDLGALTLVSAASIAGIVRGQNGQPLADVNVRAQAGDGPILFGFGFGLGRERVRTDPEGRFEIKGLRSGAWRVQTESSRHVPDSKRVELKTGERKDGVVFELREGGFVAGTVVDDLGRPVAGARVVAQRKSTQGPGIVIEGMTPGEAATTDAAGRFLIGGLEEAVVTVRASANGHDSTRKADIPLRSADVLLELKRNGVIRGTLRDTEGKPIAGSEVRAQPAGRDLPMLPAGLRPDLARTDERGEFTLTEVPSGLVDLTAEGEAHVAAGPVRVEVRPGATVEGVQLSAARGASLVVLVTDSDGQPVAGAEVEVADKEANEGTPSGPGGFRGRRIERRMGHGRDFVFDSAGRQVLGRAKTGADGKAKIQGLPTGPAVCTSTHDRLARPKPAHVTLPAAGVVETQLTMRRGGFVDLVVNDADGRPKKANVRLEGPDGEGSAPEQKTTGEDGKLRVGPLLAGTYSAMVVTEPKPMRAGGAVFVIGDNQRPIESTRTPFVVRENETTEVKVVQPVLAVVRGTVRDAQGAVAGAEVELLEGDMPRLPMAGGLAAKTDKDGAFEIPDLAPGSYRVSYGRKNAPVPFEDSLEIAPGQLEVRRDFVLNGGIVTVTVFDRDGEPLRGAKLTLGDTRPGPRRQVVMIATIDNNSDAESMSISSGDNSTTTDEDGKAELKDVPPGKYSLTIEHARHVKHVQKDVTVVAQGATPLGTLRLIAGGQLKGTVVGADGSPVQFAQVQVAPAAGGDSERAMAMNGVFRVGSLKPGRYRVTANQPGIGEQRSEPVEVEIKADETANVRVSLPAK
jgi:protocatechuate 3,4-dioxygenase beta subunit